ncbi:K+-channel ERG and related proteins [Klebsormidium nitens]|uniref:K+-channel ERG and related proteins n=1 Tax=Klebsormidium nitens TaxID=105231 RepID=A0A1Y1HNP3_KLENI|nr:K+-channel ERG and related proteins [Klebsormidium nitens]|eukprot:GAQ79653.1 K+-channel ERG and related proteins [Klebsormidium nitens]
MRRYTTHSVSRRSLTKGNMAGQEDNPLAQDTASRVSTLSEGWQREFYGKPLSELTRMSRSEDQSSIHSGKTGSSSGAGDSHSHYGRSTEKSPQGVLLPLIHPYSRARRDVNVLVAVCLLYVAIVLPYEFCFNVHVKGYWLIADSIVTVIFLLDVLVNFRTGFVLKGKREVKDGLRILMPAKIVMEPRAIARRYVKGWFTIDFLSSFPWDFLLFAPSVSRRYWVLQVLRALKILRIHRLSIVRSELRETWSAGQREFIDICLLFFLTLYFSQFRVRLFVAVGKLQQTPAAVTLYFSHLCACLFVAVGKLQSDPQRWLDQSHYDDHGESGTLSDAPEIDVYIASMYFQMISLATVGYGDIHAGITIPDRAFMTVADLFGALLMAYIVGKISSIIIMKRDRRYALRERFATLHTYVAREQLPEWLSTRLMVHLSRQWSSQIIEFSEVELIKDMTDELRSEMLIHWWRKTIPSSALLPHKHGFLALLLAKCKMQVHPQRETLTREGETVRQLWILRAGQLAVSRSVALNDLDITTAGVSDEEPSDEDTPHDPKDADARQLSQIASSKRPDQRYLRRLPAYNWAVDLDRGDQSDKALVTEMAAPGTIIGEAPLVLALAQKVLKERSAKHAGAKGKRKLAVKAIKQDVTVECKAECSVLVLLLDDLFEILDQYPSLTHKLKKAIIRAERHTKRNDTTSSFNLPRESDG